MPLTLTSRPPLTASSLNEIVYSFQRRDYEVDSVDIGTETINLAASEGDVTADFAANDVLWLSTETTEVNVATVVFSTGQTRITVLEDLLNTGSGYINLLKRDDYKVSINFYDPFNNITPSFKDRFEVTPLVSGALDFDAATQLTSLTKPNLNPAPTIGLNESERSVNFYIEAIEFYDQTTHSVIDDSTDQAFRRYAIYSRQQFNDSNYPSMELYQISPVSTTASKFLMRTEEPLAVNGFQNTISFYANAFLGNVIIELVGYDINKANPVVIDNTSFPVTLGVYDYVFKGDSQYSFMSVQIKDGATPKSELKFFKVIECESVLHLEYINNLGGVSNLSAREFFQMQDNITGSINYENYTNIAQSKRQTKGDNNITIAGVVPGLDLIALREASELLLSPSIHALNTFGDRVGVISVTNNQAFSTKPAGYDFSFRLELPANFDPFYTQSRLLA